MKGPGTADILFIIMIYNKYSPPPPPLPSQSALDMMLSKDEGEGEKVE